MHKVLAWFVLSVFYLGIFWAWPLLDTTTFHGNSILAAGKIHLAVILFLVSTVAALFFAVLYEPTAKPVKQEDLEYEDTEEDLIKRGECPRDCPYLYLYVSKQSIDCGWSTPDMASCLKHHDMVFMREVGGGIVEIKATPYRSRKCVAEGYIPPLGEITQAGVDL
ncbi:MAG: hypothetical protein WC455_10000 [Dehalococcoidia bacterium]